MHRGTYPLKALLRVMWLHTVPDAEVYIRAVDLLYKNEQ